MKINKKLVVKYLFEIKFNPLPSFLDKRGSAAEQFLDTLFDSWRIDKNRIDLVSSSNKKVACFVSYRNFGFVSETPNTKDFFIDKSTDFIKKVWNIIPPNRYLRFGVRTTEYIPSKITFQKLVNSYKNNFLKLSDSQIKSLKGKLEDVSFPLDFADEKDKNIKFSFNTAPMEKRQAKQFFSDESLLAEQGIFIDSDYFNESLISKNIKQKDYLGFLKEGVEKAEFIRKAVQKILKNGGKK